MCFQRRPSFCSHPSFTDGMKPTATDRQQQTKKQQNKDFLKLRFGNFVVFAERSRFEAGTQLAQKKEQNVLLNKHRRCYCNTITRRL